MYLLGDNEITVRKGEDYEEPGWVFTYNFREVDSENVNVSYKDIYNVFVKSVPDIYVINASFNNYEIIQEITYCSGLFFYRINHNS